MRIFAAAAVATLAFAHPAAAQDLKLHGALELSGAGAVSGTNLRDGIVLAVKRSTPRAASWAARSCSRGSTRRATDHRARRHPENPRREALRAVRAGLLRLGHGDHGNGAGRGRAADHRRRSGRDHAEGNPFIFRTSFGQQSSMPKIANYFRDELKAKKVAVLYVNNDFGKGGRDISSRR